MFWEPNFDLPWEDNKYGICVTNLTEDQSIDVGQVDIWLDKDGNEFGQHASEHFFNFEYNAFRSYIQADSEDEIKLMKSLWDDRKDLTVYCKLVGLKLYSSVGLLPEIRDKHYSEKVCVEKKILREKQNILKADYRDNACFLRWQLNDFPYQFNKSRDEEILSEPFSISSHPSMKFAFFFKRKSKILWHKNTYGIVLKNFGDFGRVEFDIDLWLESECGKKFGLDSAKNHVFDKLDSGIETNIGRRKGNHGYFVNAYRRRSNIFVCCKISESTQHLNSSSIEHCLPSTSATHTTITTNSSAIQIDREFLHDIWASYERGEHDSVIKVGDSEFKVMKYLFTCRSTKFEAMFKTTNSIQLDDINEETMEALVKWCYTGQLEKTDTLDDLFIIANEYEISSLKNYCLQHMPITMNNVLYLLAESIKREDGNLKSRALACIKKMSPMEMYRATANPKWIAFKAKELELVAKMDEVLFQML